MKTMFPNIQQGAALLSALLFCPSTWAAPGDLSVSVVSRTGDPTTGPGGAPITEFDKTFFLNGGIVGQYPFSINSQGKITFAAIVDRNSESLGGIYEIGTTGIPQVIVEKGMNLPGVLVNGQSRAIDVSPWKAMSASPSGLWLAFTAYSNDLQQGFIYTSNGTSLSAAPLAWSQNLSLSEQGNFATAMSVSDGRGSTQDRFLGTLVTTMLLNDSGVVFWENGFGTSNEIFRAAQGSPASAIVFSDTPAPGFPAGDNATFKNRKNLFGVDAAGNAFFRAEVLRGSNTSVAAYRHNASDNSLTLLLVGGETLLPDPGGSNTITANVNLEDLFADTSGTVYFRGRVGSTHTGFWKIAPNGGITLIKSLSQFSAVPTDAGNITYRSVEAGDWGVAPGGTIYFSSDANLGGATRVEGMWKIDGTTFDVTTIARETDPAIPSTPAITFTAFYKLSASGDGTGSHAVFMATLSDGTEGLYATDPSGAFVKISREGEALDGSIVTALHYTPDAAGAGLAINQGAPGVNRFGSIAFVADLANSSTALVRAEFERAPTGDTYVWDGGAGDTNWHTVSAGRSNWVDSNGIPWDAPPKTDGTSVIKIGSGFLVRILDVEVVVKSITLTDSILESSLNAETDDLAGDATSKLILLGGSFSATAVETGSILKEGAGNASLISETITISDGDFIIEAGELSVSCNDASFTSTPFDVESGTLKFYGSIRFSGAQAGVRVASANAGAFLYSEELHFETDTTFEAVHADSKIGIGGPDAYGAFSFHFDGTTGEEKRTLTLTGLGEQTLYKPVTIAANGILKSTSGKFNITLPSALSLQIDGLLENYGKAVLNGGKIFTVGGGQFLNKGTVEIPGDISFLDLENQGAVRQTGDVVYSQIQNRDGSSYTLTDCRLEFNPMNPSILSFAVGSKLFVKGQGESFINFPTMDSEENFMPTLEIESDADLEIDGAWIGTSPSEERLAINVPEKSKLTLGNIRFGNFLLYGKGSVILQGTITGKGNQSRVEVALLADAIGAVIDGASAAEPTEVDFVFPPSSSDDADLVLILLTESILRDVTIGEYAKTNFSRGRKISIEDTLALGGTLTANWGVKFAGAITKPASGPPTGSFVLGAEGTLVVSGSSTRIDVPFHVFEEFRESSEIIIETGSTLTLAPGVADTIFIGGAIVRGAWKINQSATINLTDNTGASAVRGIGVGAAVSLENQSKFGSLPSPTNNLIINGKLILDGAILNMNTNTLINKANIIFKNGGKVQGNVESIRDQVGGNFVIAGALNIDGNLTTDGTLSLGASPGSGLITGDLNLLPGSEMIVEFAGTTPGTEFDFLEVGGTATLDGTLTLALLNDYRPAPGTSFQFIQAGAVSGNFTTIDQSCLPRDLRFAVTPVANGVTATIGTLSIANYAQWRAAYFYGDDLTDDLISGPTGDPDEDGQSNLLEYATDGLPCVPDSPPLTIDSAKPAILALRWANGVTDYTWQLQSSETLENPFPAAAHTNSLRSTADTRSIFELVPDSSLNAADKRFFRVEVIPVAP